MMGANGNGQQDFQAPSVRAPKKWPMVSRLQTRAPITVPLPGGTTLPITKDAHLINGFAEFDAEDQEYWIYKRLGLAATPTWQLSTGGNGPGGMYTSSQGFIYAVQTNHLWIMSTTLAGSPLDLGVIPVTDAPPYYFTEANDGPAGNNYLILTVSANSQNFAGTFAVYKNNAPADSHHATSFSRSGLCRTRRYSLRYG